MVKSCQDIFLKALILAGFYHIGSALEKSTAEDILGVSCESDEIQIMKLWFNAYAVWFPNRMKCSSDHDAFPEKHR